MNHLRKLMFCLLVLSAGAGCEARLNSGDIAPDFTLSGLSGGESRLSGFRGHPVIVVFSAVHCGPCRLELPHLQQLYRSFYSKGLIVLWINAWDEPQQLVEKFADVNRIDFPVLLNGSEVFAGSYGGKGVPSTYILDRNGKIVWHKSGWDESNHSEMRAILVSLF